MYRSPARPTNVPAVVVSSSRLRRLTGCASAASRASVTSDASEALERVRCKRMLGGSLLGKPEEVPDLARRDVPENQGHDWDADDGTRLDSQGGIDDVACGVDEQTSHTERIRPAPSNEEPVSTRRTRDADHGEQEWSPGAHARERLSSAWVQLPHWLQSAARTE